MSTMSARRMLRNSQYHRDIPLAKAMATPRARQAADAASIAHPIHG